MGIYGQEDAELFDCDILMFNRSIKTPAKELVQLRNKYGFKIVLDLDDYWVLGSTHPLYKSWKEGQFGEDILSYVKIADHVLVTNYSLYTKVREYNQAASIVPNALTFTHPTQPPRSGKMKFIYSGSVTHIPDLEILRSKFRRIEPFVRDSASFVLAGVGEHKGWDKPKEIFESTGSYEFMPVLPLDRYMEHYDTADVALVPLVDNEFNKHKSVLKVLEAASRGLPCIVSNVLPYKELGPNAPIMWANTGADWLRHIRFCIKNPNWVKHQGMRLYDFMKAKFSLDDVNKLRYEILRSVLHQ
jgi:glycosyltransferase involved in cell wall biosynthesis